jgi:hypothetical protein
MEIDAFHTVSERFSDAAYKDFGQGLIYHFPQQSTAPLPHAPRRLGNRLRVTILMPNSCAGGELLVFSISNHACGS